MTDYGRDLEFGVSVEPLAGPPDWAARVAKAADRAGLDLVGIQDHPYQRRFLDTWTLISTLVPVTEHIRFFPDVANLPLRPPAMLAKAAASLDVLSGGRVEIGLGAGAFWDAVAGMGGPRRSPGEAVRSVEEAIKVMRLVWSDERSLRFDGEFYSLKGMRPGPHPVHDIGIWIGSYGPKMLDLIGRLADGWVPSHGNSPPGRLPGLDHARAALRIPDRHGVAGGELRLAHRSHIPDHAHGYVDLGGGDVDLEFSAPALDDGAVGRDDSNRRVRPESAGP